MSNNQYTVVSKGFIRFLGSMPILGVAAVLLTLGGLIENLADWISGGYDD